jgi:hypothetical protein
VPLGKNATTGKEKKIERKNEKGKEPASENKLILTRILFDFNPWEGGNIGTSWPSERWGPGGRGFNDSGCWLHDFCVADAVVSGMAGEGWGWRTLWLCRGGGNWPGDELGKSAVWSWGAGESNQPG